MDRKVGDLEICAYRWQWQECERCGEPAEYKATFLLPDCRTNPASSAYRHNDCTHCSDAHVFVCEEHEYVGLAGYEPCSWFPLSRFPHMGWYKVEDKDATVELKRLWENGMSEPCTAEVDVFGDVPFCVPGGRGDG